MRRLMILTASKIFTTHLYIHGASHFVSVGVLFFNMNNSFGNDWICSTPSTRGWFQEKINDNAGRCLNYLKAKCSFISFPEAMQLPFAVRSVSEFPIISIWTCTLSKHWHSHVSGKKNRWNGWERWGKLREDEEWETRDGKSCWTGSKKEDKPGRES